MRRQIASACRTAGRDPAGVVLTAVTKTQPPEALEAALAAGQRVFGENRVQEAQAHWSAFRPAVPDLELRLIGPLQTNKAADAVALFDVIETLDRPKLADALIEHARAAGLTVEGLMCIPPADEAPGPHFALLRKIARRHGLEVLSMGMSGDYETAIRFGATHVRLGSALFGERNRVETSSSD